MKSMYEAKFPGCHSGTVTDWQFEWVEGGFRISELSRSFKFNFDEAEMNLLSCNSFAEHMEGRLPHAFPDYLHYLWRDIKNGQCEDGIQVGFDSLGKWCIACEQAVPNNEFWEQYNGRSNSLQLARK